MTPHASRRLLMGIDLGRMASGLPVCKRCLEIAMREDAA